MNRVLQWLNFLGILALAGLCAVQWSINRRLNLATGALERTRIAQDQRISEQAKTITDQAADLDEFRTRVHLSEDALADAGKKLRSLQGERDQLAASLQQWKSAVAQRDAVIKQAAAEIQKALDDRNDAVKKFNDLATKYNALVK
jgi:chromosome segregation ATPase